MDSDGDTAAQLAARYDRLIAALGEDVFRASTGGYTQVGDPAADVTEAECDEQRQELLAAATDKSVRCAELIAKSLEASAALFKLQKTLKDAYEQSKEDGGDGDEDMNSEEDDAQEDEATTLLLQDLVAAGDEAEDAVKRLGVVRKTARASHELLVSAEHDLQDHLASGSPGDAAVQNEFRQLYMEEFTTAFGDELDKFRQEERFESKDVTYLISCIQAGGDVFSPLQQKLFVESVGAHGASE